jgi:hypothetical protein
MPPARGFGQQAVEARLDAPVLEEADPRWGRLPPEAADGGARRDRFRSALVGGAIGDAMGRANEGVPAAEARAPG